MANKLATILNFEACKKAVETAKGKNETYIILLNNYSSNIAAQYDDEDGQALQDDLDELEKFIGETVQVNQYDDLVVDLNEDK